MKKKYFLFPLLALVLVLSGCGRFVSIMPGTELPAEMTGETEQDAFEAKSLFAFLGWGSFGENYYSDTPVAMSYQKEAGEDGVRGCRAYRFDRASIITACDILRGMTVTGEGEQPSQAGGEFTFTLSGGKEYDVTFAPTADGGHVLKSGDGWYAIDGDAGLWDIAFPSYSGDFDIFDLYFDDAVRAFADNFDADTPVSVGYRINSGVAITSDDPDVVHSVFSTLRNAAVVTVENQPDQTIDLTQVRDYVFTMADGSTYVFSFAQQCLAVTANSTFGTVYYWLSGTEGLGDISFAKDDANAFEGGTVASLRDDMQQTADAANGGGEVTVSSVFVEYSIGENSGYLALRDDKAAEFVRTLTEISVSSDTEQSPAGDRITVSVTLSDGTGPIFYFTGNTIQQMVGTNYVCDSGQMETLRNTVLSLASDSDNAVEVEDGGTD